MSLLLRRGVISSGKGGAFAVNSANLDGSTHSFSAADSSDLEPTTGDFTVSIWFKTSTNTLMSLINKGDGSVTYWDIFINAGVIEMRADDGPNNRHYKTINTFDDGNWHHLVARYNNYGAFLITVDDVAESLTAVATGTVTSVDTSNLFQIGKWFSLTTFNFNGEIGFSSIFTTTLSNSEITELYNLGVPKCHNSLSSGIKTNLSAFWDVANWTGHTSQELTDQSGNGNTLTNVGSTPFTGTGLSVEC